MSNIVNSVFIGKEGEIEELNNITFETILNSIPSDISILNGDGKSEGYYKFISDKFILKIDCESFNIIIDNIFNTHESIDSSCYKFLRNYGIIDYIKSIENNNELNLEYNKELTNNFSNINNGNDGLMLNQDIINYLNNHLADSLDYYNYLKLSNENKKLRRWRNRGYYIISFLMILLIITSLDAINYYKLLHNTLDILSKLNN